VTLRVRHVDEAAKSVHQSEPGTEGWEFSAVVSVISTSVSTEHAMNAVSDCTVS